MKNLFLFLVLVVLSCNCVMAQMFLHAGYLELAVI